ncbi:MAG: DUF5938 domain-containing protein [Myxococcales bacterium]|nr:DUF5938 domain-containing protein [Myxococcales bacterium]
MGTERLVVVYGATGYTGELTCEDLTRRGIPFVAAGRNQERLQALVDRLRGEGADAEAIAIDHNEAELRRLLHGRKVCINISGPYQVLGRDVVAASMAEACHYIDVTGEQDFMLDMKREFGDVARDKELVLLVSNAFHWAPGACAAAIALETEGIDTVEVVYKVFGRMTIASAKSTFRVGKRPQFEIEDGELRQIEYRKGHRMLVPPGESATVPACPMGTAEIVWFVDDPRVRKMEVLRADPASVGIAKSFVFMERLQKVVSRKRLDWLTDTLTDKLWKRPPPEDEEETRWTVWAEGRGSQVTSRCVLRGSKPYVLTGHLGGEAAERILAGNILKTGFVGTHEAFGARSIMKSFEKCGATMTEPADDPPEIRTNGKAAARPAVGA